MKYKTVFLGEITILKNGKKKPSENGGFPVYGGNGAYDNTNNFNSENAVIVGRVGAYCGSVHYEKEKHWVSDNAISVRSIDGVTDILYVKYLLDTLQLNKRSIGTSQPLLTQRIIKEIVVQVPDIDEQVKVASVLGLLDDKIENNKAIISNLEEQAQAIFKSWFIDFEPFQDGEFVNSELGQIPKGWEIGKFKDVIKFKNGYGFKSKELNDFPVQYNDLKVFKMGDIKVGGGLNPGRTKSWIPLSFLEDHKLGKYIAQKGWLLMCMTDMKNNVRLLGHTALMSVSDKYVINQRVGIIEPREESNFSASLLYFLTNSKDFLEDLRSRANSGVQVNLSTKEIKDSAILIPTQKILVVANEIFDAIIEKIFNLQKQNQTLAQLRDTLLPKLMSGEIRVGQDKIEQ